MFHKILVPLDGSEVAECVLPHVKALADGNERVSIIFLYAVAPLDIPLINIRYRNKILTDAKKAATSYLKKILESSGLSDLAESKVIVGKAADSIVDFAIKNKMDLIVMATHGLSGVSRWLYGSVADKVVHESPTPVWLIKAGSSQKAPYATRQPLRILVPLDGSPVAESVLPYLKQVHLQFQQYEQDIILVRVCEIFSPPIGYPPPLSMSWEEYIDYEKNRCLDICRSYLQRVQRRLARNDIKVRIEVPEGNPAEALIDLINKNSINLVILSTHGRTGFSRWAFGSVAEKVLKGANCPVLLARVKK